MDYSAANAQLWNIMIQLGLIAGAIIVATGLRNSIQFFRKSLMPISVIGGFLLLALKYIGIVTIDNTIMESLVYHGIALGFIAMSLRVKEKAEEKSGDKIGLKSGAIIVSTYLVQAITGLVITAALGYTVMPKLFKASGILLPMAYGQGPGQANNIGSTYETLGFAGGRSFGLSLAATGYIVACVVGVILMNLLSKKNLIPAAKRETEEAGTSVHFFQADNEIPVSDSIDKLSIQLCLILLVYLITYGVTRGLTGGITMISPGVGKTVNSLLWGFNFIIGSALALLCTALLEKGKKAGMIKRQYQNNYLLNRLSGFFFDIMIVAGIASINFEDLSGLWIPFLLIAVAGGIITWLHLKFVCGKVYKGYYYEGLISMFGMLTGTISSGVLLLREIDPDLATPAADNLVVGSSFGIVFGAPMLVLVGLAPKSEIMLFITMGLIVVYFAFLMFIILKTGRKRG